MSKIVQVLLHQGYGDAIGNDCLAIDRILRHDGWDTGIYARVVDKRIPADTAKPLSELSGLDDDDIVLYHLSTGTDLNFKVSGIPGRKVVIYHNITPPGFFLSPSNYRMYKTCEEGLFQTRMMTGIVDYCLADSEFNRQELIRMGYKCPVDVQPILIPFWEYDLEPDEDFMRRFSDGKVNILFTGRLAPNKKQGDLIQAFRVFHRLVPDSRLIIAGAYDRSERYVDDLIEYVGDIGLSNDILFTGHIPFDKIIALYRTASFFWCLSEHEGFCVPLVEAMYFGIPIIAYNSSAVPETLGGSGVLLDDKQPELVAHVTKALMDDFGMRTGIIERQWMQLGSFSYDIAAARFRANLAKIIASFQEDSR